MFLLINGKSWSPGEAAWPVTLILLGYELAAAPVGLMELHGMFSRKPQVAPRKLWQFNLRTLLALMLLVGLDMAIIRLAMNQGATTLVILAVGVGVATLLASAAVFVLAFRRRALEPSPA